MLNGINGKSFLKTHLYFVNSYPEGISRNIIEKQACALTKIIVDSATFFFRVTEISTKESKGWWNENIKMARNELKNSLRIYIVKDEQLQTTMTMFF